MENVSTSVQLLEQPVDFVQSLELVQTTVCAVVSTVSSLRCLFPEECFKIHHYDVKSPNSSYKDFKDSIKQSPTTSEIGRKRKDGRYVPWEILVPGTSVGVDKLLDWMERGVADALSQKYLNTLQLSIYDSEVSLSKRIETYIMAFSYDADGVQMDLQLSGNTALSPHALKTMSSAKEELRYLVHRLSVHIGGFPKLPAQSIVNMHFTYNEFCPPAYQPPGFVVSQDYELILRKDQGAQVGAIHPGPHRVELKVFLNEDMCDVSNRPNQHNMITLRHLASKTRRSGSLVPNKDGMTISQEALHTADISVQATLQPVRYHNRLATVVSNITGAPDTQERAQLTAIASMARLRSARDDLQDTQILSTIEPQNMDRSGSIDLDGESTVIEGSSTQGSPSIAGDRRSARQAALRSATDTPPRDVVVMLRPRKRNRAAEEVVRTLKLPKLSKARSPFATSSLREYADKI